MIPISFVRTVSLGLAAAAWAVCGAAEYKAEVFVPGAGLHCIHGLTFDAKDRLYVGSVVGQQLYRVDTKTGAHEIYVGPSEGLADDMEVAPDGSLVWTSIIQGFVRAKAEGGEVRVLAKGLPGINSIAFNSEGRLFAAEVFLGDALYEIDYAGEKPPRQILKDIGGLNGFDFGPDGFLYGPLWFKGQVVRVNVDSGELTVVAEGFKIPAAANFNSKGVLHVLDSAVGDIVTVDTKTGAKAVVAHLKTAMDNLAFDSHDNLYVTVMSESAVYEVDTKTGTSRLVRTNTLGVPADMAIWRDGGAETIYLADTFALRSVDPATGKVTDIARFVETDLDYPSGITVTDKHIHTTGFFGGVVQTFDRKTGKTLATRHGFAAPFDVLELEDGSLIVAQLAAGNLVHVTGEADSDRTAIAEGLVTPSALAFAGKDAIYVVQAMKGEVTRINLATKERAAVAQGLKGPEGLAVDATGRLIVSEVGARRVVAIDPSNGAVTVLAEDLPIGLALSPGMPPIGVQTGVAVTAKGEIVVSADIEDALYKLTPR